MKNYRIKKVSKPGYLPTYCPQRKVLGFFWVSVFTDGGCPFFSTYEHANKSLCSAIAKPKVEYLGVNCESIQND